MFALIVEFCRYFRNWKRIRTAWNIDENCDFHKYQKKYNLKRAVILVGDLDQFNPDKYPLVYTNAKIGRLAMNVEPEYGLEVSNIIASTRNKYKCDICTMRYQTYIELKYHALSHENEAACDDRVVEEEPCSSITILSSCQSNFTKETSPIISAASELECEVCGANFDSNFKYEAHIILHKKFSCTNCSARFSTSNELVNHAMQIHGVVHEITVQQNVSKEVVKETLNHSEAEVLKYRCKVCNRRFADCFQLQRHKRMHSKDAKNTEEKQTVKIGCDLCNQEFSSKEDMHEHRKEHLKPLPILNDDDIVIVSIADAVAKPKNSVINVESSDSDNDSIHIVESHNSEPTVTISIPTFQSPTTYTTVNTTAGEMNKLITITNITSKSTPNQMANANEMEPPIILNKTFAPESTLQCMVCNFTSTNEIVMNEHHKIHGTYSAQPSQVTLTATINQNLRQITNIVAQTSENSAITADHLSTTTITTPSMNAVPSTSWGNQVVIISPSPASGQIIQHPIFIIPGNNSSNNTSNVDINIRTTNQPKTAPKTVTAKKTPNILRKGTPRKILPAPQSDPSALISILQKSPTQTIDSLPIKDNITLNLKENPVIDVDDEKQEQAPNVDTINNSNLINIAVNLEQNPAIEIDGDKREQAQNVDWINNSGLINIAERKPSIQENTCPSKDINVDALLRDTVIKSSANQSEAFASDAVSQKSIQKPKISVKPLSLLMKSPIKGNIVEIQPVAVPEIGIINTSPEQNKPLVPIEKESTSRLINIRKLTPQSSQELPKLTAISKAQLFELLSKKPIPVVINKPNPPITKLVALPKIVTTTTTATATTSTVVTTSTPTLSAVVTKIAPKMPKATTQNKAVTKSTNSKIAFSKSNKKTDSLESTTPILERALHKCDSCSYEAKKRSKLHMHCKFKCKLCHFITCKLNNLDLHYESTHSIINICCPCDIRFPDGNTLLEHKNKVHVCPNCNKCQIDLAKHVNSCKCPLCNFTTCKLNLLTTHYKATHNIVRNCAPCNIAFGSVSDFEDHKYSMHFCPKCRTYKMNLNVHKTFCKGNALKILECVESLENLEVIEVD